MRILIAEDEVTIVRALKVMLERNKYAVDVVFNGKDALDYWGFVCMGLHLGLHWSMMLTMVRKHLQPSPPRTRYLRLIGWLWALYGAFAFHRRGVGLYLLLKSHFMFYDDSEPVIYFLISEIRANRKRATCWLCSLQKVIRTGGNRDSACFCPYFAPNG